MPTTMTLIAKQTVGVGGTAGVTFSNIPQTFTDLKVVFSTRSSGTSGLQIRFNGSTSNRTNVRLYGNGNGTTASFSGSDVFTYHNRSSFTANTFDSSEMYIPNYTSSNLKSVSIDNVTETNAAALDSQLQAGLWSQTAAITSLGFFPDGSQTLVQNSEFSLYGIYNNTTTQIISGPSAFGGDIITSDGTYWYHTFLYSGTFTPLKELTCDYLVVGGGGGGGYSQGGGGGGGGLRSTVTASGGTPGTVETALTLNSTTPYNAVVGAGGVGSTSAQAFGLNGGNSIFASITSTGGGGGGTGGVQGRNGGSGGGTGGNGPGGTFGTGVTTQGFNGGTCATSGNFGGGGGGGAGVVGSNGTTSAGGNGGNGKAISISGSSVTYAGGGGGSTFSGGSPGTGGTGGGGNGGASSSGQAGFPGTTNLGGGGGGSGYGPSFPGSAGPGGNGGAGIIIVRYAV
jgi:hypothetical protein